MNWYLAKLRFQLLGESYPTTLHWDEQLCLIPATSPEEALSKAHQVGLKKQDYFLDRHYQQIKRQFVRVTELEFLGHLLNTIRWSSLSSASLVEIPAISHTSLVITATPHARLWLHQIVHTTVRITITSFYKLQRLGIAFGVLK